MFKRISAMAVALIILVSLILPAGAQGYATRAEVLDMLLEAADVYNPDAKASDIMRGDAGGLRENDPVTRAEALVMLSRAFGKLPELSGNNLRIAIPKDSFTDIPAWADKELEGVFDAGLVAGTGEGIFSPGANVTKEQMKLFIGRAYALYGTNPKDDFYAAINRELLEKVELPSYMTDYGIFSALNELTHNQIYSIIYDVVSKTQSPGTEGAQIKTFYDNIMNISSRNAMGYSEIKEMLDAIDDAESISDLDRITAPDGTSMVVYTFADFWPTVDAVNSDTYIDEFSIWMPDLTQEVYNGEAGYIKDASIKYYADLLALCGEEPEEAKKNAGRYFAFEKQLSDASLSAEELKDVKKTYNIYTLEEIQAQFKSIDIKKIYAERGLSDGDKINVADVGAMKKGAELLCDENIDELKNVAKIKLIISAADCFGEEFIAVGNEYRRTVYGIRQDPRLIDTALNTISNIFTPYLGKMYAEHYCSDEVVRDVTDMIEEILAQYKKRLSEIDWMAQQTKEKALLKLDTMKVYIGKPDTYEDFLGETVLKSAANGGTYFQNMSDIYKANRKYAMDTAKKPVNKDAWSCTPYEVNAFYSPINNSINFPAGILQAPFYDKNASREENLGGIGMFIAHEITHAFDNMGAQFDENGNMTNWWTEEDYASFEEKCEKVVSFFKNQESAPGIQENSKLTLSENIADMGALSCLTEIGEQTPGFDFKKMFEAYACAWFSVNTRESLRLRAMTDSHSSDKVRVNRTLQSIDKFYEVYEIKEGDGMYVPPEERVSVW